MLGFMIRWIEEQFPDAKEYIEKALLVYQDEQVILNGVLESLKKYTNDTGDSFIDLFKAFLEQLPAPEHRPPILRASHADVSLSSVNRTFPGEKDAVKKALGFGIPAFEIFMQLIKLGLPMFLEWMAQRSSEKLQAEALEANKVNADKVAAKKEEAEKKKAKHKPVKPVEEKKPVIAPEEKKPEIPPEETKTEPVHDQ